MPFRSSVLIRSGVLATRLLAGERSVARGIIKALRRAQRLIYIEDQYLWSPSVIAPFCAALEAQPALLLIAVLPLYPDQDGRFSRVPNLVGRYEALKMLRRRVVAVSPRTVWKTTRAPPCTSMPRSASSTTSGRPSARTTSTGGRGLTIPSCHVPSWTRQLRPKVTRPSRASLSHSASLLHADTLTVLTATTGTWRKAPSHLPRSCSRPLS